MSKIIALALMVFWLAGCAPSVQMVDFHQKALSLSLGMNKSDVTHILGAPKRTEVIEESERWIYWNKVRSGNTYIDNEQLATDRLTVTFINGAVSDWGQDILSDDNQDSSNIMIQASKEIPADASTENK